MQSWQPECQLSPSGQVHAELMPEEKLERIETLRSEASVMVVILNGMRLLRG